jgi:FlaG/FlaF family flagellin (archaellin)
MRRNRGIFGRKHEDNAVAEIIGTILVFAIVVSILTAFVAWYVPTEGASNEQSYQQAALTAFSELSSKLSSQSLQNGSIVVQSIPLGVNGVEPFEQSYATQLSSTSSSQAINFTLRFQLSVNYTQSPDAKSNLKIPVNISGSGALLEYGSTNFITPETFSIQDGNLVSSYGTQSSSTSHGPMPVYISGGNGSAILDTRAVSIGGYPLTISQIGSLVMTLAVSNYSSIQYSTGHSYLINGNISTINNITLTNYDYYLKTPFFRQWNYSLYSDLNDSFSFYNPSPSGTSWNAGNFTVSVGSGYINISSRGAVMLSSIEFSSYVIKVIST